MSAAVDDEELDARCGASTSGVGVSGDARRHGENSRARPSARGAAAMVLLPIGKLGDGGGGGGDGGGGGGDGRGRRRNRGGGGKEGEKSGLRKKH